MLFGKVFRRKTKENKMYCFYKYYEPQKNGNGLSVYKTRDQILREYFGTWFLKMERTS